jgi:hypothetical protein
LKHLFADIRNGENIDLIPIVFVTFIIAILNAFGVVSVTLVSSITLTCLGLIAIGFLQTRYQIAKTHFSIDTSNLIRFHERRLETLQQNLNHAQEIWMLGITLRDVTYNNYFRFKEVVSTGGKIRVMLLDPASYNMEQLAKRFGRASSGKQFETQYEQTFNQFEEIRSAANGVGRIEVRVINFVPSCGLVVFPTSVGNAKGIIYVETYGYKPISGSIPKYQIKENENAYWYSHFLAQYEAIWKDAEVYRFRSGA